MFTPELKNLLIKVISSWQVIAVTVVLVLYFFLVNYVARLRRGGRSSDIPEPSTVKKGAPVETPPQDDDLGLEEKKA